MGFGFGWGSWLVACRRCDCHLAGGPPVGGSMRPWWAARGCPRESLLCHKGLVGWLLSSRLCRSRESLASRRVLGSAGKSRSSESHSRRVEGVLLESDSPRRAGFGGINGRDHPHAFARDRRHLLVGLFSACTISSPRATSVCSRHHPRRLVLSPRAGGLPYCFSRRGRGGMHHDEAEVA